jgi:hypothetical protein
VTVRAYKFLAPGQHSPFTDHQWEVPGVTGEVGWGVVELPLRHCENGWHACRPEHLSYWLAAELWEVELSGKVVEMGSSLVAERARLRRRVPRWPEIGAAFMAACAWRIRDLAVREARYAGAAGLADRLAACAELAAVAAVASAGQEQVGDDEVAALWGYAEDAVAYTNGDDPAAVAYVAAHAADRASPEPGQQILGDVTPFQRERVWQAQWLTKMLGLAEAAEG